jgi:hypothetical protein
MSDWLASGAIGRMPMDKTRMHVWAHPVVGLSSYWGSYGGYEKAEAWDG